MKLVSLLPLKEIDFPNQKAFQSYNKKHKLRPSTKVNIAGKQTTAGQAAKVKGTSVFRGDNSKSNSNKIEPIIKNIADLTDRNDHNGAVMALAKMTGDKTYIEQMQKIQRYHELKGHMPQSLIKYRTAIMNNLLTQAKNQFGDKVAKQLHNAF
jgi:hypothetical protein